MQEDDGHSRMFWNIVDVRVVAKAHLYLVIDPELEKKHEAEA